LKKFMAFEIVGISTVFTNVILCLVVNIIFLILLIWGSSLTWRMDISI
jgi:hypothetical protein